MGLRVSQIAFKRVISTRSAKVTNQEQLS